MALTRVVREERTCDDASIKINTATRAPHCPVSLPSARRRLADSPSLSAFRCCDAAFAWLGLAWPCLALSGLTHVLGSVRGRCAGFPALRALVCNLTATKETVKAKTWVSRHWSWLIESRGQLTAADELLRAP